MAHGGAYCVEGDDHVGGNFLIGMTYTGQSGRLLFTRGEGFPTLQMSQRYQPLCQRPRRQVINDGIQRLPFLGGDTFQMG